MTQKKAVIIGAGPAGLTAAYELLDKTDIIPVIYEMSEDIGGISKTVNYKGNHIDIGGHRFFSKSDRVMRWWLDIMPLQGSEEPNDKTQIHYQKAATFIELKADGPSPEKEDLVMLIRSRLSRIYFLRKFFDYPIRLSFDTFAKLGLVRIFKIGMSYVKARLFPIRQEKSLEDFFINRFGKELYGTFFKDYTEKVWGNKCSEISPEWGAQRIKGLSITKAIWHALKNIFQTSHSIEQKNIETSLIEQFMYPKFGPGQLWEQVAKTIQAKGGKIHLRHHVVGFKNSQNSIQQVKIKNLTEGVEFLADADYIFSTMPVRELISGIEGAPENVREIAQGLIYRDFITVGLLLRKLKIKNETNLATPSHLVPDNWIYIQEREVKLGRLQIFNNWSPYMVKDPNTAWIGLEYFRNEGDELWTKEDTEFSRFAIDELALIDIIDPQDVLDSVVIRMPKTYPAYFGSYDRFDDLRKFVDSFENLFLVGRNGMHRYNNQDHSMLTAMVAVENIINEVKTKNNIWDVNTEQTYHEKK